MILNCEYKVIFKKRWIKFWCFVRKYKVYNIRMFLLPHPLILPILRKFWVLWNISVWKGVLQVKKFEMHWVKTWFGGRTWVEKCASILQSVCAHLLLSFWEQSALWFPCSGSAVYFFCLCVSVVCVFRNTHNPLYLIKSIVDCYIPSIIWCHLTL
jgi:hypothetical protein